MFWKGKPLTDANAKAYADLAMAICGIVFALVIAAPWIMIACQVTTRGPF